MKRAVRASAAGFPAVVYGAFKTRRPSASTPKTFCKIIRSKTGHNTIFDVEIAGVETTPVMVVDQQYDPVKGTCCMSISSASI